MRRALATMILVAAAGEAAGNPLDSFGFSARAEGLAGALTGDATGFAAAHHNPAGVARTDDVEAAVGWGYGVTRLSLDGRDAGVTSPRGTSIGLAVPILLGRATDPGFHPRAAFGLALYVPDQFIARIQLIPASEPHFVLLDNNLQHVVVTPVIALQPLPWISLGVGATLLADAAGAGVDFDVGVVGGEKVGRASLDVSLPIRAALVAGLQVLPTRRLRLGLAYRGAIDLALQLDVLAHVDVAGAVRGDALISLRAFNFYTPERLSLGAAFDAGGGVTLHADLAWVRWSAFRGGLPDLRIRIDLSVSPALLTELFPPDGFRDTLVPRLAAEWRRPVAAHLDAAARLGYGYERSPVPDQTGLTSFADANQHVIAAGAGLTITPFGAAAAILPRPISVDVALQWHELEARTTRKDPRLFPGEGLRAEGRIVHFAVTVGARL